MTKTQWVLLVLLVLAIITLYGGAIPFAVFLALNPETPAIAESPDEPPEIALGPESYPTPAPTPTRLPTRTPTALSSPTATATNPPTSTTTPTHTRTRAPTATPTRAPTRVPTAALIASNTLANLALNPRAMLVSKTSFFTSACFGQGANPRQDRDFMTPADWSGAEDRKCVFGFGVNPGDGQPRGRYSVHGGADGQPRFYIIPPEAFAQDQQRIKQLSGMHLIVDPDQGCDALGSIGITADGVNYQCSACNFLRSGGVCPTADGSKMLALPVNRNNLLTPDQTGGAFGFVGYPLVLFRRGFSLYFTGRAGYAPQRTWFESGVDTLLPEVSVKTTAEMTDREIKEIAAQFDGALSGVNPISQLVALEQEAQLTTPAQVTLASKERTVFSFVAPVGTVLSSVSWTIKPILNQGKRDFLETNLCLDLNGEEFCFTGVEDFAHCAFFTPCKTGYAMLEPTAGEGYLATRFFPPGSAPLIADPRINAKLIAPDVGTTLEIEVKVRVRHVDPTAVRQR
ncbi:MAG: hypothetical protein HY782_07095 [Chloroflexi bacterium]|nr:hypothetical protein [Chloroflexota bacterium]